MLNIDVYGLSTNTALPPETLYRIGNTDTPAGVGIGIGMSGPIGGGADISIRRCCGDDNMIYEETYISASVVASVGAAYRFTKPGAGGNITSYTSLPKCSKLGSQPVSRIFDDSEDLPISFQVGPVTGGQDQMGLTIGTGAAMNFHLVDKEWYVYRLGPFGSCCK